MMADYLLLTAVNDSWLIIEHTVVVKFNFFNQEGSLKWNGEKVKKWWCEKGNQFY